MRYIIMAIISVLLSGWAQGQDSVLIQSERPFMVRNEFYPVMNQAHSGFGAGFGVEFQKQLALSSRIGLGYSLNAFDRHSAKSFDLTYYQESNADRPVQASIGFGVFLRKWTYHKGMPDAPGSHRFTSGYLISLGAKTRINERVTFSTRFLFNNNMNSEQTFSLRPGVTLIL